MKKDEGGYIVVETIVSFVLFTFLTVSILSLINIVTVQARIHYAITQAAQTVSVYTYVMDVTGVADHLIASAQKGDKIENDLNIFKKNVNGVLNAISELDLDGVQNSGGAVLDQTKAFADEVSNDPSGLFKDFLNFALKKALSEAFEAVIKPLVNHYLANGDISGDEYLERFGVVGGIDGLNFNNDLKDLLDFDLGQGGFTSATDQSSAFLTSDGDVRIIVRYNIDYTFGALPLPFTQLEITQEVRTKAWLSGLGEGYVDE